MPCRHGGAVAVTLRQSMVTGGAAPATPTLLLLADPLGSEPFLSAAIKPHDTQLLGDSSSSATATTFTLACDTGTTSLPDGKRTFRELTSVPSASMRRASQQLRTPSDKRISAGIARP